MGQLWAMQPEGVSEITERKTYKQGFPEQSVRSSVFVIFSFESEREEIVFDLLDGFQPMFLLLIPMPHGTRCSPAKDRSDPHS